MARTPEDYHTRADQAADGFRTLISLLGGALTGTLAFVEPKKISDAADAADPVAIHIAFFVALFGLIILGVSWVVQKSKSLARAEVAPCDLPKPWYIRNEIYDVVGYASFIFALVLSSVEFDLLTRFLLAIIAAGLFLILVLAVNLLISKQKASCSKPKECSDKKSQDGHSKV